MTQNFEQAPYHMSSIKEQIAALRVRFDALQAAVGEQAKANVELRNKLAHLSASIDLLVEAEEKQIWRRRNLKRNEAAPAYAEGGP